jgi:hypothetical protein
MTALAAVGTSDDAPATPAPRSRWAPLTLAALVVVVASPVAVAAAALAEAPWIPVGDWASMAFRTSQVGTSDTPLVGAYATNGWAHPGPLLYWLAAPLFRLTGGDPRALGWTAAAINVATIAALAGVAWRRGRWPLTVGVMGLTAVLVHGIGPELLVDLWNPHAPLLPFLLTAMLVWDAALGRRRAIVEAAFPAVLAMHAHLAFVSLVALLVVGLWAWARWWPRLLDQDSAATAELPRRPWSPWWRTARWAVGVTAVASVGPLIDSVVDLHNPWRIVRSFGGDATRLGPLDAVGLVGRYVRPDGPWMGGSAPLADLSVQGSGPLPVIVALLVLGGCLRVARRRALVDVTALACLALLLVLGSIVATSQFVLPVERYLAQWLKIVGALVWFTPAWTGWRLLEPTVRSPARRRLARAVSGAAVVAAAAWSWGDAVDAKPQFPDEGQVVHELGAELAAVLPDDQIIRFERRGEPWHIYGPGLFYDLVERGVPVVTSEGQAGLKWGHDHRWLAGQDFDMLITVAVHDPGSWFDAVAECERSRSATLLAEHDALSPGDRAWLEDFKLRRWEDGASVTAAEIERGDRLEAHGLRIAVYEGPRVCAKDHALLDEPEGLDDRPSG